MEALFSDVGDMGGKADFWGPSKENGKEKDELCCGNVELGESAAAQAVGNCSKLEVNTWEEKLPPGHTRSFLFVDE